MSFLSKLIPPSRKGEKNLERGRAAEVRRDFETAETYFRRAADAFDEHLKVKDAAGKDVRPSHLVMAGIAYTRIGRDRDAINVLDRCLAIKPIPDAFLHAGYAAAKLGEVALAVDYWSKYPAWADQSHIAKALREQVESLRNGGDPEEACQAVAKAVFLQDRRDIGRRLMSRGRKEIPHHRGY
ncbi:tetratricopeptide repeat protein [Pseudodesulfovibrio sp.]|uniref:tetratricopeptide repeat protein n=1 Tax=unclassified Pseudodesulfovibrio TaxID=2661612 RepID=UPI003B00AF13